MATTAGEVSELREIRKSSSGFEWKIPLLHPVMQRIGDVCQSPQFKFCNGEWTFTLKKLWNCVDAHLIRRSSTSSHENNAVCKLFKIDSDGSDVFIRESRHKFCGEYQNRNVFTDHQYLWSNERNFGVKIICSIDCFECKSEPLVVHLMCSGSLGRNVMDLLTSGEGSDLTISVKERVFRVHKIILRARSPVFFSTLKHDMTEKRSGNVDIPDCDPEAFQKFLEHIYSGELKDLSQDVVYSVYYIADKYQVSEVKEECVKFMSENLSLETFFDVAEWSARHEELELLESATEFFIDNTKDIIQTDKWVTFFQENPVAANDFYKKLLVPEVYHGKGRKLGSTSGKDVTLKKRKVNSSDGESTNYHDCTVQ